MEFRHKQHEWRAGPPKTKKSYRTIPLTDTAYQILRDLYLGCEYRKEAPELDKVLTYIDCRTAKQAKLHMRDLVFINYRTGMPAKNSSYDTHLYKLCDKAIAIGNPPLLSQLDWDSQGGLSPASHRACDFHRTRRSINANYLLRVCEITSLSL